MKVAMGALAVLTIIGGLLQIPGVSSELHHFLEPTFHDSELYETLEPSVAQEWIGLLIGAVIGITGIGIAWRIYGHGGKAEAIQARFGALHRLFVNKWYFDEAINFLIVRPTAWLGRFCATHGRARVRQRRADRRLDRRRADALGGRARDPVRLPALLRRAAADRLHGSGRLLPGGRVNIHLSILIFFPLFCGVLSAFTPKGVAPTIMLIGTVVPLAYAVMLIADFDTAGGLQHVTDDEWISELGIRYKLGVDGLNLWLVALTSVVAFASAMWLIVRPVERAGLFAFHMGLGQTAVLGAFLAQDLALFVLFFDLMLVPFYFLVGQWGGPERVAAAIKMVIYTLVGSLLMLAAAVATAVLTADTTGQLSFVLTDLYANPLPESTQKWLFVGVRAGVPDQDAGVPVPRLDAGRVPDDAVAGAGVLLRRGLEGRRLRLPEARAAAVPGRDGGLQHDPADPGHRSRSCTARCRRSRRRTRG